VPLAIDTSCRGPGGHHLPLPKEPGVRGGSASDAALVVNTLAGMGVAPVYLVR
jgi:hypothetical protein